MKNPVKAGSVALLLIAFVLCCNNAWAVEADDVLWQKPTYEKKIYEIGQKIIRANNINEKIVFRVERNSVVNAHASDLVAEVTIESGLFGFIDNDAELAGVIGHEIAHVMMRHGVQRQSAQKKRGLLVKTPLMLVGGVLLGAPGIMAANSLGNSINRGGNNKTSRDFETEADEIGLDLMVKAGYDPHAFETIMQKICGDGALKDSWRSHPMGTERLAHISSLIKTKYADWKPANTEALKTNPIESLQSSLPPGSIVVPLQQPSSPSGSIPQYSLPPGSIIIPPQYSLPPGSIVIPPQSGNVLFPQLPPGSIVIPPQSTASTSVASPAKEEKSSSAQPAAAKPAPASDKPEKSTIDTKAKVSTSAKK